MTYQSPQFIEANKAVQFKPGVSGNPAGKPKGTKHLSTHIQSLLNSEAFMSKLDTSDTLIKEYRGKPVAAIIQVYVIKALQGDTKAADLLFKYGYGSKIEMEHSGDTSITVVTRGAGSLPEQIQQTVADTQVQARHTAAIEGEIVADNSTIDTEDDI